jgi:glutathione S-transferase
MNHIFHIATQQDWDAAIEAGDYRVSTLRRTLAEVGFIHCSTAAQVQTVADRYYRGLMDLLLLTVETARLSSRMQLDPVGQEMYPHIYGPLNLDAVVDVTPLVTAPDGAIKVPDLST